MKTKLKAHPFVTVAIVLAVVGVLGAVFAYSNSSAEPSDADSVDAVNAAFDRLEQHPFSVRTAFTQTVTGEGVKPGEDATFATGDVDLKTHQSALTEVSPELTASRAPQAVVVDDVAFMYVGADAAGEPILVRADRADRAGLVALLPAMAVLIDLPSWVRETAVPGKFLGERDGISHWSVKLDPTAMEELTSTLIAQIKDESERSAATLALTNNTFRYVPAGDVHVWVTKDGTPKRVAVELTLGERSTAGASTGALSWYITGPADEVTPDPLPGTPRGIAAAVTEINAVADTLNAPRPALPGDPAGP
jgi:hypothetical protein